MFETLSQQGFSIQMLHHAEAILRHDMPEAASEIEESLSSLRIPIEEIVRGGGGEGQATQRMRHALETHGWRKHRFEVKKVVDGLDKESISHEIDHVKHYGEWTVALEIEWNNKDPFFDRDLENFKRLHADGVISVGCIITRSAGLQDGVTELLERFAVQRGIDSVDALSAFYSPTNRQRKRYDTFAARHGSFASGWAHAFTSDKFGQATTHWRKLKDRINRGVGNPCPLLLVGIPRSVIEA